MHRGHPTELADSNEFFYIIITNNHSSHSLFIDCHGIDEILITGNLVIVNGFS